MPIELRQPDDSIFSDAEFRSRASGGRSRAKRDSRFFFNGRQRNIAIYVLYRIEQRRLLELFPVEQGLLFNGRLRGLAECERTDSICGVQPEVIEVCLKDVSTELQCDVTPPIIRNRIAEYAEKSR